MNKSVFPRIIIDVAVFFSVLNGWWYVALPLTLIGFWFFAFFFELVLAGIGYDALFGMVASYGLFGYLGTILSISIASVVKLVKMSVRR